MCLSCRSPSRFCGFCGFSCRAPGSGFGWIWMECLEKWRVDHLGSICSVGKGLGELWLLPRIVVLWGAVAQGAAVQ